MKFLAKKGSTSKRFMIFIPDSSSTAGAGKTGITYASSGLKWCASREDDGNAGATSVTPVTMTRGTWASGGIAEKDSTNKPGWYEIGVPNALLASGSSWVCMEIWGVTGMAPVLIEIQLVNFDPDDGNLGLTGLTGLTAPTAGALPTGGTGTNQISLSGGVAQSDIAKCGGSAVAAGAIPNAAADSNGGLLVIGTGTRQLNPNAGGVSIAFNGRQQIWEFLTTDSTLPANSFAKLLSDMSAILTIVAGMYENSSGYRWTSHALMQAPTGGGLTEANVRTALGMADADLDDQLDALATAIAAVKGRTDNLPDDPADASVIAAAFTTVNTTLGTIAGYIDTEVAAALAVLVKINGMLEADGDVYRFTTNSLEQAPTGLSTELADKLDAVHSVLTTPMPELTEVPPAEPTFVQAQMWDYMRWRNQRETSNTTDKVHNDAGDVVGTQSLNDDGTKLTRGKAA